MNSNLIIVVFAAAFCVGQAKADPTIFDDSQSSPKAQKQPAHAPPTPPPSAAPAPTPPAATQASGDVVDQLKAEILQLQKENAELKSKVKELTETLTAVETRNLAADKAKQEREQRITAAKARDEQDRLSKIKVGVSLSEAERLAKNKAKITHSEMIHLQPRVGYFGPLDVRKEECTLTFTKTGGDTELTLVVTNGVITELSSK
jgi:flagellar motility protein MotE (MotC chaperone)